MLTIVVKKMCFIVKATLLVLVLLLVIPRIAAASCSSPSPEMQSEVMEVSAMIEGYRELGEFECASYRGTVFLDEDLPIRFLGIHLSDISIVQAAEGVVIASVDFSELSRDDVIAQGNDVTVGLPEPRIACHDLTPTWNIYPRSLPIGSADDIAVLENSMAEEARALLCQQALENGLLQQAKFELEIQASQLAEVVGFEGRISLEFGSPVSI